MSGMQHQSIPTKKFKQGPHQNSKHTDNPIMSFNVPQLCLQHKYQQKSLEKVCNQALIILIPGLWLSPEPGKQSIERT